MELLKPYTINQPDEGKGGGGLPAIIPLLWYPKTALPNTLDDGYLAIDTNGLVHRIPQFCAYRYRRTTIQGSNMSMQTGYIVSRWLAEEVLAHAAWGLPAIQDYNPDGWHRGSRA